jgi:hypothetical protein
MVDLALILVLRRLRCCRSARISGSEVGASNISLGMAVGGAFQERSLCVAPSSAVEVLLENLRARFVAHDLVSYGGARHSYILQ